jgi:ribosome maturation factor RimP
MKKYSVHFSGYYAYDVDVEAENEEEAQEKAESIIENVEPNDFYFENGQTDVWETKE